jgi:hypothetical protein
MADDFQQTACMALLKLVVEMHDNGHVASTTDSDHQDNLEGFNGHLENSDSTFESSDGDHAIPCDAADGSCQLQLATVATPPVERDTLEDLQHDSSTADDVDEKHDVGEEELSQCAADITDDGDDTQNALLSYEQKPKGKSAVLD